MFIPTMYRLFEITKQILQWVLEKVGGDWVHLRMTAQCWDTGPGSGRRDSRWWGRPWGCGCWMDCAVEIIDLCSWNPTAMSQISARACGPSDGTVCQLVTDTCRPFKDSTHLFFFFFAPTFPLELPYRSFVVSPGGASGPIPLSLLLLSACLFFLGSLLTLRPSDLL